MLATYMRRMRNNNLNSLEIRIAGSSCLPQLAFWKKKRIGIIFNWGISTTQTPPPPQAQNLSRKFKNYCRSPVIERDGVKFGAVLTVIK